uniref:breast cancer metastasis-suppressor 1-like protein isoform X2 n=1 Tax=Nyctereutes procyonoides TaxID=34880 RepID=UPI002443B8AF|nr:breast cancer metastasis-suppressor 1-like protein isoform X2 [Nyctereutes procyonoides]
MPVHSRGDKKETNHHDEMEVDYAENEGSSSEDEDTESSSVSEDGDSSEMDDEDCERRRMECLDEMSNLEKQFTDLKDQLYKERLSQVDAKLQEVIAGKAPEYLEPLATLQENMQIRTKVAGIYRELCLESVKNKYECEIQASRQHCESEKLLLYDTVQSELEEKIRRLEEDRHSIDITSELWNDELQSRKKRKDPFSPDKKKPVVVSGPYIVYMLQDLDILEDWTTIRKAMATLGPHRVKTEPPVKLEKHLHSARSEEGRLYYDGEWYIRGQTICIDKKDECPTRSLLSLPVKLLKGILGNDHGPSPLCARLPKQEETQERETAVLATLPARFLLYSIGSLDLLFCTSILSFKRFCKILALYCFSVR